MIAKENLEFLKDIKANNNRDWFMANKKRYEQYKKDYVVLVSAFIEQMQKLDPSLRHLEPKDCMFRINRDIRFTKDKSPYKTNLAIWMSTGQKNTNLAGYYVHVEPGGSFMAGGVYYPDAPDLKKIRSEIAYFHEDLEKIVTEKKFRDVFGALDRNEDNALKTMPKGYEKDHPAAEFLKLKCFTATRKIADKDLKSKDFVKATCQDLIALRPLNEFLNRALTHE